MYSSQLVKGTFQTIILKVLESRDRMYGYEITQRVRELSHDEIIVTEGSLYPILHKMEEEGWLVAERVNIGNRVRRYYSLTKSGKGVLAKKLSEFERFVTTMQSIFFPQTS